MSLKQVNICSLDYGFILEMFVMKYHYSKLIVAFYIAAQSYAIITVLNTSDEMKIYIKN